MDQIGLQTVASSFDWLALATALQAFAVAFAGYYGGSKVKDYLDQKKVEHRYDLAVESFSYCRRAAAILVAFKSSSLVSRNLIESLKHTPSVFAKFSLRQGGHYIEELNNHKDFFEKMHVFSAEARLILGKEGEEPLNALLQSYIKLRSLFEGITHAAQLIIDDAMMLGAEQTEELMNDIEDALVQVFEHISISERQEQYLQQLNANDKENISKLSSEDQDKWKGVTREYHYLNSSIDRAMKLADEIYPKIIATR